MSTPNDREFAYWHRVASENLIQAASNDHRVGELLDVSSDYGRRALKRATNQRERMLAMGLLMTAEGIRVLHDIGELDKLPPQMP